MRFLLAVVPPDVPPSGRHDDGVARFRASLVAGDATPDAAGEHLHPFLLPRMDVFLRDHALRLDKELELEELTAGLGRGLPGEESTPHRRVLENVTCSSHRPQQPLTPRDALQPS